MSLKSLALCGAVLLFALAGCRNQALEQSDADAREMEKELHQQEQQTTQDQKVAQASTETETAAEKPGAWKTTPGLYAIFDTTKGQIVCKLYEKEAPKTVQNFVGLAEGTKEWTDPHTGKKVKKPFYDGLVFHRVIPNFMIQGGDPLGTGTGGPGYQFADEFSPKLSFDGVGRLAMANAGPNTNGSQFFITVAPTAWLNGHHTIFGQVVEGQQVADAISMVPRDGNDRPNEPMVMKKVTIKRVGGNTKGTA